jgi:phosphate/phosphite/phosphonate ABC transporter binding protein
MKVWLLTLLLILGCEDRPETARTRIDRVSAEVMYSQAREALLQAGIRELTWAVTPFVSTTSVDEQYRPTINLVSQRLGIPMNILVGESYADVEHLLLSGEADIAVMSPYAYVQAKAQVPDIQVFATHIANGTESYGAYILARTDSDIQNLNDIKGKRFAFVDPRSTSGWLFPASRMMDEGINPLKDIEGHFYGNHQRVIEAIVSGEVAAGSTYDGALATGRGNIAGAGNLEVIARTQRIPYDAYVLRTGIPKGVILGLQKALSSVSTRDPGGRSALAPLMDINGFIQADNADYKSVRAVDRRVRQLLELGGTLPTAIPLPTEPDTP